MKESITDKITLHIDMLIYWKSDNIFVFRTIDDKRAGWESGLVLGILSEYLALEKGKKVKSEWYCGVQCEAHQLPITSLISYNSQVSQ